eukprot:12132472-Ditylum_brightwellii.AAC.1
MGGMQVVLQDQLGTVGRRVRESIWMNLMGYRKAQSIVLACLETSLGFLKTVMNFINDTYQDFEAADFHVQLPGNLFQN